MIVRITKTERIKSINLRFLGKARTEWPEGKADPLDPNVIDAKLLTRTCSRYSAQKDTIS